MKSVVDLTTPEYGCSMSSIVAQFSASVRAEPTVPILQLAHRGLEIDITHTVVNGYKYIS